MATTQNATAVKRSTRADDARLQAALDLDDPLGVLSIYVDADPALAGGPRPAWQIPVRDGLRRIVGEARKDWVRERRIALEACLDRLEPELETLLDPRGSSRSRVLFAAISTPELVRVELRTPLPSLVASGSMARALPLAAALAEGRAAGLVVVDRRQIDVYEWELDELRPVVSLKLTEADPEGRGSPGRTNPAVPQQSPERDRFAHGHDARLANEVRAVSERLRRLARERGWDTVVAAGDPRLVDELEPSFPKGGLVRALAPLAALSGAERAVQTGALVREVRGAEARRVAGLLEASPLVTRGSGAVSVALDQGRVDHVVLDPSAPPDAERLLRAALATSAEVTITPTAEVAAALLRW
jgi:hypothetical protein